MREELIQQLMNYRINKKPFAQQPFVNIVGFSGINVIYPVYVHPKILVLKTPQHLQAAGTLCNSLAKRT